MISNLNTITVAIRPTPANRILQRGMNPLSKKGQNRCSRIFHRTYLAIKCDKLQSVFSSQTNKVSIRPLPMPAHRSQRNAAKRFIVSQEHVLRGVLDSPQKIKRFSHSHSRRLFLFSLVLPGTSQESQEAALCHRRRVEVRSPRYKLVSPCMVDVVLDCARYEHINVKQRLTHRRGLQLPART